MNRNQCSRSPEYAKITTQEWCENFYDDYVFATIRQKQLWPIFCEATYEKLVQTDPNFSAVDASDFTEQLLALRLEVIGIAWLIRVKDDLAPRQSKCTRLYLHTRNRDDLWAMMEPYNQAVAKSIVGMSDSNTRIGRAHISMVNTTRADLFDKWVGGVDDLEDAARPANRYGCQTTWKSGRNANYLSFALTRQLNCEITDEARDLLIGVIFGLFEGTSEQLQGVKIVS